MTCCVINSSLRWHAGSVTILCEAHLTTSPTSVACPSARLDMESASRKAEEGPG